MSIPPYMQTPPIAPPHRTAVLLAVTALVLAGLACAVAFTRPWWSSAPGNAAAAMAWNAAQQREYATKLMQEGLSDQAARAFESYLQLPGVTSQELAAVAYTIGKLHMDAARYEDALAAFYRVELADAAAAQRAPAARAIVTCLERLGRARDARYVLDQETALRKPAGRTNERATVRVQQFDDRLGGPASSPAATP